MKRFFKSAEGAGDVVPPEGVPLSFKIAGVGVRFGAQVTDLLITFGAAGALLLVLAQTELAGPQTLFAIGALVFFAIRVPYYAFTELLWNGQTLGKRLMKIKVVSHDGGPLTTHALVLRNLMKEAEVFLPATLLLTLDAATPVASWLSFGWILMALLIPLLNRHRMRLGDIMAGTHVIHLPDPVLLKDLATQPAPRVVGPKKSGFSFLAHHLDHYGAFELQTLETLLRAQEKSGNRSQQQATIAAVVDKIRAKIGYADPVRPADHLAFLRAFYNAQRQHLEQRQLFGDKRENKHYAASDEAP